MNAVSQDQKRELPKAHPKTDLDSRNWGVAPQPESFDGEFGVGGEGS